MTSDLEEQVGSYVRWLVAEAPAGNPNSRKKPRRVPKRGWVAVAAVLLVAVVGGAAWLGGQREMESLVATAPATSRLSPVESSAARAIKATVESQGDLRVFTVAWDDGRREEFARIEWGWEVLDPQVTHDGESIVYVAARGMAVDLYLLDRGAERPRNLTLEIHDVQAGPFLSPDSLFVAMGRTGGGIHIIPLELGEPIVTILADVSHDAVLEWTEAGTIVLVSGEGSARQRLEYDIDGSLVRRAPPPEQP